MDEVILTALFSRETGQPVRFFWSGEGRQRNLICEMNGRRVAARVPTEYTTYDDDGTPVGSEPLRFDTVVAAAERLVVYCSQKRLRT